MEEKSTTESGDAAIGPGVVRVVTSTPGQELTRCCDEVGDFLCVRTADEIYFEAVWDKGASIYQLIGDRHRSLRVNYRQGSGAELVIGFYRASGDGWKLLSGSAGAPANLAELRDRWPLRYQPFILANIVSRILPRPVADWLDGMASHIDPGQLWKWFDDDDDPVGYKFFSAFCKAVAKHSDDIGTYVSGWTGNIFAGVLGLGENCDDWQKWVFNWFNANGWATQGFKIEHVHIGSWPFAHVFIRIVMPDGRRFILDPWRDPERPVWEEDQYERQFGPVQFDW